ncbi:bifunctional diaminohydroxyphosphoribosylaminopyrimidine deaminase/5-amino-6-(5-phosphoribosylamino)uracil reductase RibD [Pontibacillus salipaludis]|uniref:Riboflavin biosynthesis protein RibD n=1 Tax=Pontibacillus salipaludis TaxID=1697394 RepID=A0ABQ1PQB0_9BACI|nr:bifunctional diaminohydroxyphosphoribosylaminopyrimidine deaminase/5-amino-6-(5-phosphoribosylamino)uracil reductase RibD [Pontibacillus salipaludis]GGD01324.1 riboflavin biosynthesis protein RibD [Pontibacillus salipaludis]
MNQDERYMRTAIEMAQATEGQTSPNPAVGAVVVKDGEVLGMGAHLKAGHAHAEVHALNMAGSHAEGATIYVTLEPCSHHGKTPPCADRIVEAGIKRAVIATLDPNPQVAGRGVEKLKQAGIEVVTNVLKEQADDLNEVFYHYISTKIPYVTLKNAMSLDGKIATVTGESQWITGEKARADVHQDRHKHDAILVGVNTVIKDQPRLTTRLPDGGKNPVRIVLDTHLRTPVETPLIQNPDAPTWLVAGNNVSEEQREKYKAFPHVDILTVASSHVTVEEALHLLGEKGITSIYVEGGATVNDAFLRSGSVQQVITYIAPKMIGGQDAPTPVGGQGIKALKEALNLHIKEVVHIGNDLKIVSKPNR